MYHCGSSPTEIILSLEMCRILITQAREKRLWGISCDWLIQQRASGLVVKTIYMLCNVPLWFSPTEVIL
jgi:hypothetical protein